MPAPEDTRNNFNQNEQTTQEPPPRELTQTDHINKKLLVSLFNRMDQEGDIILSKTMEPEQNTTQDDEWKD